MVEPQDNDLRMSLAEHLAELRSRLLRCTLSVLVLGTAALVFARPLFGLLMRPVLQALPPESRALIYTSGVEELSVLMKVGLYAGVFLTTPVLLWQLWSFVSPGLYPEERRYAGPFVVLGTVAFLLGASFCYFAVLPTMFQFLLRGEATAELEQRLEVARLQEEDALRYLRIGELERAGPLAQQASQALKVQDEVKAWGEPQVVPSERVELAERLEGLGRLVDAAAQGLGPSARVVLRQAVEKRVEAAAAFGQEDYSAATRALDEGASLLAGAVPTRTEELASLWRLEKELAQGRALHLSEAWTRPMLTMSEQLSLVLVLLLAFGIIFELPIVMALLGVVGVVRSSWLFRYQRHAFVVCLVLAAIITPTGDVVNLSLMAGPMLLCYELGVLAVWLIERRRTRAEAAAGLPADS